MSDLRIGQRCRLVNMNGALSSGWRDCEGDEVTILALPGASKKWPSQYQISEPKHVRNPRPWDRYFVPRFCLRPLTDPGADAFMERIKKLGREPINLTEKVTR